MTERTWESDGELLDAYLDGLLDVSERTAFEQRIEHEPQLRRLLSRQRQIDAALVRIYAPGNAQERVLARVRAVTSAAARRSPLVSFLGRGLAIAAVLALSATAIWFSWKSTQPSAAPPSTSYPPLNLAEAYQYEVSKGLQPGWVCKTDDEFVSAFRKRYRQPLLLAMAPAGVETIGLTYCDVVGRYATMLLARVEGTPVLVFINLARRDKGQSVDPESGLKLYQRHIGRLVLYELTPLERAHLLDLFVDPEQR